MTAHPVVPLTSGDVDALRAASVPWFAVALTLGSGCGLRQGEATGLTVDRIDFLRREMTVDRQLLPIVPKGEQAELGGTPKTDRSYRKVPLADVVVADLAFHLREHGTGRDGLVLHNDGLPVRRQAFGKEWRALRSRAASRAGEGPVAARLATARFHDTRHTYASILLSGGVSVAAAGRIPRALPGDAAGYLRAPHAGRQRPGPVGR